MSNIQGTFPNKLEKERINTVKKFSQLYNNQQKNVFSLHPILQRQFKNKADAIYIAHAIPSKISDFYGDFVQGEADLLSFELTNSQEAEEETLQKIVSENDLHSKIYEFAVDQSQYGFEVVNCYTEGGDFKIQIIGKDQYFPQKDGSVILASYIEVGDVEDKKKKYLYTQHYFEEGDKVKIERKAWTLDDEGKAKDEVSLSVIGIELNEEEKLDIDEIPIVKIDNGKRSYYGFSKSDYVDIMPNLQEVNERVSQISTQFLKNLDAILQLPIQEGEQKKLEGGEEQNIDYIEVTAEEADIAKFISFDTSALEALDKFVSNQIKFISWATGVPAFEFSGTAQPERVESLRIRMFSAIRKTETKRRFITKGINDIVRIGFKLLGKTLSEDNQVSVSYSDVIPIDPLVEAQVEEVKVRNGLSSKKRAIKRLHNYTEEELEEEMTNIRMEDLQSGVVNPDQPPTV